MKHMKKHEVPELTPQEILQETISLSIASKLEAMKKKKKNMKRQYKITWFHFDDDIQYRIS